MCLCWVIANVLDVPKDVPTAILTDKVSEICSQSHICYGGLLIAPFLNWEAFEEDEALSIENFSLDRVKQN
jgi:hypothetical protein